MTAASAFRYTLATCLLALPLAAQPAARLPHDAEVLSRWRPPVPQQCRVLRYPKTLPAAAVLVDSDAVINQAAHLRGYALFTLKFGVDGVAQRRGPVQSKRPPTEISTALVARPSQACA